MTTSPIRPRKPLLCRLNVHHKWQLQHAPGGGQYRRCTKCGKGDPGGYLEGTRDITGGGHF